MGTVIIVRVSAGLFKWATVGGVIYPKPYRASYVIGEDVRIEFAWRNTGGVVLNATIKVTDADTGESVWSYTMPSTDAGHMAMMLGAAGSQIIGKMPDKAIWNLRCEIIP